MRALRVTVESIYLLNIPKRSWRAVTAREHTKLRCTSPRLTGHTGGTVPVLSGCSGAARRRAVVQLGYRRVLTTRTAGPGPRERSVELTAVVRDARDILVGSDPTRGGKGIKP